MPLKHFVRGTDHRPRAAEIGLARDDRQLPKTDCLVCYFPHPRARVAIHWSTFTITEYGDI
jgi:hypothetical protein